MAAQAFTRNGQTRGRAWIEAFDNVPMMALLQTMRDLDLFRPTTIGSNTFPQPIPQHQEKNSGAPGRSGSPCQATARIIFAEMMMACLRAPATQAF
jgi:hypothetical protein